eukprot:CAMPEP_0119133408 /NCGR_PEP_ID=MMETSP1310-20130426/13356_1 /TAXON_ID=464262 /ORGANISM="Genus nov. species nov., Strain RCC2339" /LENGTH=380 /DNA_ID=CAMNT_0007124095 /DNA_START=159 /DNA_END=1301 /DNA_ORIENTATION=-
MAETRLRNGWELYLYDDQNKTPYRHYHGKDGSSYCVAEPGRTFQIHVRQLSGDGQYYGVQFSLDGRSLHTTRLGHANHGKVFKKKNYKSPKDDQTVTVRKFQFQECKVVDPGVKSFPGNALGVMGSHSKAATPFVSSKVGLVEVKVWRAEYLGQKWRKRKERNFDKNVQAARRGTKEWQNASTKTGLTEPEVRESDLQYLSSSYKKLNTVATLSLQIETEYALRMRNIIGSSGSENMSVVATMPPPPASVSQPPSAMNSHGLVPALVTPVDDLCSVPFPPYMPHQGPDAVPGVGSTHLPSVSMVLGVADGGKQEVPEGLGLPQPLAQEHLADLTDVGAFASGPPSEKRAKLDDDNFDITFSTGKWGMRMAPSQMMGFPDM